MEDAILLELDILIGRQNLECKKVSHAKRRANSNSPRNCFLWGRAKIARLVVAREPPDG
jgi:hypothetical protein